MDIIGYVACILIGLVLGLIGGGGSILTMPVMVYLFAIEPLIATSYTLFVVGISSLIGVLARIRSGLIKPRVALLFAITSVLTVFLTRKFLLPKLPATLFEWNDLPVTTSVIIMLLFAVLMILSAFSMITNSRKSAIKPVDTGINYPLLALYGIGIGLLTGFLGAGGGFLIIPALVLLCKLQMKEAVATSLLIISVNSLVGFVVDQGHFVMDWKLLITVTGLAIIGILIGSQLSKKIRNEKLKKAFGWFVLVMGSYVIIKEIFFR